LPWELVKIHQAAKSPLVGVISIRVKEIAVSRDLVDKYFRNPNENIDRDDFSKVQIFLNRETGEIGFRPVPTVEEGYCLKNRKGKTSCVLNTRKFLKNHPITPDHYKAIWNDEEKLLIIKVWEPEKPIPQEEPEPEYVEDEVEPEPDRDQTVDFCPKCEELGFKDGVCPHCGYKADSQNIPKVCPHGCAEPRGEFSSHHIIDDKCLDCASFKRQWGSRPAACKWEGWE